MVNKLIMIAVFFVMYFNVSGLATTNIIRLTKGNTLPILSPKCRCDHCGEKIPVFLQLPIISYVVCKGKCRFCGTDIPIYPLILEISTLLGMLVISAVFKFSLIGISCSFIYYEILRIVMILILGKRDEDFLKQYVIAVLTMIPYYMVTLFSSLIYGSFT